jgi:hypothetical protein
MIKLTLYDRDRWFLFLQTTPGSPGVYILLLGGLDLPSYLSIWICPCMYIVINFSIQ